MCSVLVVIADVLAQQPFEMPFIQYDHVIQQVSSTIANPTFGGSGANRDVRPVRVDVGDVRSDEWAS
jgi:hypothetical protein